MYDIVEAVKKEPAESELWQDSGDGFGDYFGQFSRQPKDIDKRAKTGISGLDKMLGGGIPRGNLVVLSGAPGTGKTILSWQFLHEGITKFNENGIYVSLEEAPETVILSAGRFGWDFEKLIKEKKLRIIPVHMYNFETMQLAIESTILEINAARVVFDPGIIFSLFFNNELDARKKIVDLNKMLKRIGCTTLITNEVSFEKISFPFGMQEYVADGVIHLYHTKQGNRFSRKIGIFKMRNTRISELLETMSITSTGIKVVANNTH